MLFLKMKLDQGIFGYCPRILCEEQVMLPYGRSDDPNDKCETMAFCPRCKGLFTPENMYHQKINGAHFGPSFP